MLNVEIYVLVYWYSALPCNGARRQRKTKKQNKKRHIQPAQFEIPSSYHPKASSPTLKHRCRFVFTMAFDSVIMRVQWGLGCWSARAISQSRRQTCESTEILWIPSVQRYKISKEPEQSCKARKSLGSVYYSGVELYDHRKVFPHSPQSSLDTNLEGTHLPTQCQPAGETLLARAPKSIPPLLYIRT